MPADHLYEQQENGFQEGAVASCLSAVPGLASWGLVWTTSMGCGSPNKGPESRSFFHHHSSPKHDLADPALHHLQPAPGGGSCGKCKCGGGQLSQTGETYKGY